MVNIIVSQAIAHANFHPHNNFLMVVTWQLGMDIHLHSQCLMATFKYWLWSSCSIQSLVVPTERVVFCWYGSARVWGACTLWMVLQPWLKSPKGLYSNKWKGVLVLSSLKTYDNIFFECFVISASSGLFQTLFSRLIPTYFRTCDFLIYLKDRLVLQARPFPFL